MANIGASYPYYAIYSHTGSAVLYHDGGIMGELVNFNFSVEGNSGNNNDFYANNRVKETQRNRFSSGTATVATDDLTQEASKAVLGLSESELPAIPGVTDVGVKMLSYDDDQNTPYLGIGVVQKKQRDNVDYWRAIILKKIMFDVPEDAAETEGETINWQTPELNGTVLRDDSAKHQWKCEATFTTEEQARAFIRYILNIPSSTNAKLGTLRVGNLVLNPAFDPDTISYTAATGNDSDVVAAVPVDGDATVAIEVNDEEVENGGTAEWDSGSNTVTFTVTAADGTTTKTYTVTVTKS